MDEDCSSLQRRQGDEVVRLVQTACTKLPQIKILSSKGNFQMAVGIETGGQV